MNISKEQIDELNAVVNIELKPDDYREQVEKTLKNYAKKAQMPGFRPGKVPYGMVKKMYGKSVMAEEINKILSDSLYKYLNENKLNILGNPLPKTDDQPVNFDEGQEFKFSYDIGLAPEFEVKLDPGKSFNYYLIKADDELINEQVNSIRERYGKLIQPEVSEESDMLTGDFTQLDPSGNVLEDGIKKSSSIFLRKIKDEKVKKSLTGLKVGDKTKVNPKDIWETEELTKMLGVSSEIATDFNSEFEFTVTGINRLEPAELNQELFDKIYGEGAVTSEEEFRNKIAEELRNYYRADADKKLFNDITEYLINELKLSLPDEFLKRWMMTASEKPITIDEINKDYDNYSKGIKWQLIENKIIKENNITVTPEEVQEFTKHLLRQRFASYGQGNPDEKILEETSKKLLQNKEEAQKIYEQLFGTKIMELFKKTFKLVNKELPIKDYIETVYKTN